MTAIMERGALRPKGAAAWLDISRDTLDRLIASGDLKFFTVGRARFVSAKELERFISDREAEAR